MRCKKSKVFIGMLIIFIVIFSIFIVQIVFTSNNFLSFNRHIDTKKVSEFVITDDKSNKISVTSNDNNFKIICDILNNSKTYLYSGGVLEYDSEKDFIELRSDRKIKKLYTHSSDNGKVLIIINDLFENLSTSVKLDYPFYIVTEISLSDFYTIFPNSTLLSSNLITVSLSINNDSNNSSQLTGKIFVRNDNEYAIRVDKINYSEKNVLIIADLPKIILPHSDYEVTVKIKSKKDRKNIVHHLKKSNLEFICLSVANSNDRCIVSDIDYNYESEPAV